MVTIGMTDQHYEMIVDLIDGHLENLVNQPTDEIVIGVVNDWLEVLRAFNDPDTTNGIIAEVESALDDIQNGY